MNGWMDEWLLPADGLDKFFRGKRNLFPFTVPLGSHMFVFIFIFIFILSFIFDRRIRCPAFYAFVPLLIFGGFGYICLIHSFIHPSISARA